MRKHKSKICAVVAAVLALGMIAASYFGSVTVVSTMHATTNGIVVALGQHQASVVRTIPPSNMVAVMNTVILPRTNLAGLKVSGATMLDGVTLTNLGYYDASRTVVWVVGDSFSSASAGKWPNLLTNAVNGPPEWRAWAGGTFTNLATNGFTLTDVTNVWAQHIAPAVPGIATAGKQMLVLGMFGVNQEGGQGGAATYSALANTQILEEMYRQMRASNIVVLASTIPAVISDDNSRNWTVYKAYVNDWYRRHSKIDYLYDLAALMHNAFDSDTNSITGTVPVYDVDGIHPSDFIKTNLMWGIAYTLRQGPGKRGYDLRNQTVLAWNTNFWRVQIAHSNSTFQIFKIADNTGRLYGNGSGITNVTAAAATITNVYEFAVSDETNAITTGTAKLTWRAPHAMTVIAVRALLATTSSSGDPVVDINDSGTTILSTKLSIDASEKTSVTAASAAVISDSAIADDAEVTFDIDTAGTSAAGLKVKIYYTRP